MSLYQIDNALGNTTPKQCQLLSGRLYVINVSPFHQKSNRGVQHCEFNMNYSDRPPSCHNQSLFFVSRTHSSPFHSLPPLLSLSLFLCLFLFLFQSLTLSCSLCSSFQKFSERTLKLVVCEVQSAPLSDAPSELRRAMRK